MNVSTLIGKIQERYNAQNDTFFSDAFYWEVIQTAQTILALDGYVIEESYYTTSTSGTREISFPSNALAIKEIKYDYEILKKANLKDDPKVSSTDPSGTPTHYGIWNDVIYLYPTPDTTSDRIDIKAYIYPSDITSALTVIQVPTQYILDIINYSLSQMALKDQNLALYREYYGLWSLRLEKIKKDRDRRLNADRNGQVRNEYFEPWDFTEIASYDI